ncbi:MAG: hypothetical protein M1814_006888 [Vezdaea aestivalis]|nr:MAG: hypothetical protein M1814_006888 [Vezdaea aestivalis]
MLIHNEPEKGFESNRDEAYKTIWLFAMRHFPDMIGIAPRKEKGRPAPLIKEPNPWLWYQLASLAHKLGFQSPQTNKILASNPNLISARKFLSEYCRSSQVRLDQMETDGICEQFAAILGNVKQEERTQEIPIRFTTIESGEDVSRRSGRPFEKAQVSDKLLLSLPTVDKLEFVEKNEGITSLFVKCDFFSSFFHDSSCKRAGGPVFELFLENDTSDCSICDARTVDK